MSLWEKIFAEEELRQKPPVLVDVGASGGVHQVWLKIAKYSIGIGFEPDSRETDALSKAQRRFRRWIFVPALAADATPAHGRHIFHLTRSPQCSSVLRPSQAGLAEWAFADRFDVVETLEVNAVGLAEGLREHRIDYVDWLKCDTQGMDLRLFHSLPAACRLQVLALEMEPGFLDAYTGEDDMATVLRSMRGEPMWLSRFDVCRTPRGRMSELRHALGETTARRYARFGAGAPGWANLTYLRDFSREDIQLDRRAFLLGWCFAMMEGQPAAALSVAQRGAGRFGGQIFAAMMSESSRRIRRCAVFGLVHKAIRRMMRR